VLQLLGADADDGGAAVAVIDRERERAVVEFAGQAALARALQCEGLAVPMTHGYRYYRLEPRLLVASSPPKAAGDPPLALQLTPLSGKELTRRLAVLGGGGGKAAKGAGGGGRIGKHLHLVAAVEVALGSDQRPVTLLAGAPLVQPALAKGEAGGTAGDKLLAALRSFDGWPAAEDQRKGVAAAGYLTLKRKDCGGDTGAAAATADGRAELWAMCAELLAPVCSDARYNALALTKGFRGSPHVDKHDTTYQHVVALGDFTGGLLYTEADADGRQTVAMDVHGKVGRIDGRGIHWVSGWSGERYSVVYFSTDPTHQTVRAAQADHNEWMVAANNNSNSKQC
jgi:hypothetical protein